VRGAPKDKQIRSPGEWKAWAAGKLLLRCPVKEASFTDGFALRTSALHGWSNAARGQEPEAAAISATAPCVALDRQFPTRSTSPIPGLVPPAIHGGRMAGALPWPSVREKIPPTGALGTAPYSPT